MPLQDYARTRLFAPLRMRDTELRLDRAGHAWTYADARTTLRDFAKVCQLALDGGRFRGTQVVPEAWMRAVVQPIPQNPGYGMLWWLERDPVVHASRGYLNTDCYALPELGLVVARMQSSARSDATRSYGTGSELSPDIEALYRRIARRK
jgi:CubicO group peptidase (beta-lactamase class C family)